MGSIGNDIVALKATNPARTVTPRFYNKFLITNELDQYHRQLGTLSLNQFIWMAWSVKEAAFKCLQRLQPDLVFSPIKMTLTYIEVDNDLLISALTNDSSGLSASCKFNIKVSFNNQYLQGWSAVYGDEVIHTIVRTDAEGATETGLKLIQTADYQHQSSAVRAVLLDRLKVLYPAAKAGISKDAAGIPSIIMGDVSTPVSLSHHDKWVGYAF